MSNKKNDRGAGNSPSAFICPLCHNDDKVQCLCKGMPNNLGPNAVTPSRYWTEDGPDE